MPTPYNFNITAHKLSLNVMTTDLFETILNLWPGVYI